MVRHTFERLSAFTFLNISLDEGETASTSDVQYVNNINNNAHKPGRYLFGAPLKFLQLALVGWHVATNPT